MPATESAKESKEISSNGRTRVDGIGKRTAQVGSTILHPRHVEIRILDFE